VGLSPSMAFPSTPTSLGLLQTILPSRSDECSV
jgi:hypothetical protein